MIDHTDSYQPVDKWWHLNLISPQSFFGLIIAGMTMFMGALHASAADHQLITSVAGIYEYNDNIRLEPNDKFSDNIYTVAPKLELVRQHEKYTVRADGTLEFYRYQDNDEFDDMDQLYNGTFEATPTERWRVGANLHLSQDNRPDRDIEVTGLRLSNIQRNRVNAGVSAYYTFSEMLGGGLILEINRENFDDPEVSDRKDYHAVLAMTRNLDAWLVRSTGRLNLGYSHYASEREFQQTETQDFFDIATVIEDRSEVDSYSLTAGTESALTEKMNLIVDLGGRYTQSQREFELTRTFSPPLIIEAPSRIDDDFDGFGFVGSVHFTYGGERSSCDLLLSHDLVPVSGRNSTANRTTVRLGGSMRLLERLQGNLFFQWYQNLTDEEDLTIDDLDTQTWNGGVGLRWNLTDYLDLGANYTYTLLDNRQAGTTAYRNRVLVLLEAHHDWLE